MSRQSHFSLRNPVGAAAALILWILSWSCLAQPVGYTVGAGDVVKITVFQVPDLTTETRVSEAGAVSFPLIGEVTVKGLTTLEAERRIAQRLREGGFVQLPQVNMIVLKFASVHVSVLGQVNRPGRYPVEGAVHKLTDLVALAGGVTQLGADTVTLVTQRSGKEERVELDLPAMMNAGDLRPDTTVANGDLIYVPRAPVFYIYGEVQRPGQFRVEREMTVMQALAAGGGLTPRGTERGIKLHRRNGNGNVEIVRPAMRDPIRPDDVVYVRESWF